MVQSAGRRDVNAPDYMVENRLGITWLDTQKAKADELSQNYAMREQTLRSTSAFDKQALERGGVALDLDRQSLERGNLEMELLKKQQVAQAEQAKVAAQLAQEFLGQWNKAASETRGTFNVAMASIEDTQSYIKSIGEEYGTQIKSLVDQTQSDLSEYRDAYDPLEKEAIETAQMAMGAQRGMISQIKDLSKADYAGVSGRAKADVGAEMERGRRAESMELSGMGIDPTDSRYRGSMRTSRINEAINKALAANKARIGEKNRVAGVVATGLQTIDPSKMGGDISKQIQEGKRDYTGTMADLTKTGAVLQSNMAGASSDVTKTSAGLASSYGGTMMPQYGEGFMSMVGTGMATDPSKLPNLDIGGT